jgi:hypothetical protein
VVNKVLGWFAPGFSLRGFLIIFLILMDSPGLQWRQWHGSWKEKGRIEKLIPMNN